MKRRKRGEGGREVWEDRKEAWRDTRGMHTLLLGTLFGKSLHTIPEHQ